MGAGREAEDLCTWIESLGPEADLRALLPLLASTAWYDANGGDVYGGQHPVNVADTAARVLAERGAVDLLQEALGDPSPQARALAVRALGRVSGLAALAQLETALGDEREVAIEAGFALGRLLKGSEVLEALVVRSLAAPERQVGALVAAIDLPPEAILRLADVLYPLIDQRSDAAFQLVRDLPELDGRTLRWLTERAEAPSPGPRWQAARLLRSFLSNRRQGVAPFVALVLRLEQDPEDWVRDEARRDMPYPVRVAKGFV